MLVEAWCEEGAVMMSGRVKNHLPTSQGAKRAVSLVNKDGRPRDESEGCVDDLVIPILRCCCWSSEPVPCFSCSEHMNVPSMESTGLSCALWVVQRRGSAWANGTKKGNRSYIVYGGQDRCLECHLSRKIGAHQVI